MTEEPLSLPVLLSSEHELAGFDCGKAPLNDFLVKYALQNQASGGARTYVLTRGKRVIGYYSLAPASVAPEDAPARVMKGQGRYPVPVILMARFALDLSEQGKVTAKSCSATPSAAPWPGRKRSAGAPFLFMQKMKKPAPFMRALAWKPRRQIRCIFSCSSKIFANHSTPPNRRNPERV